MRTLLAIVVLVGYLGASLGVLPGPGAFSAVAAWGERFPCESCGCGCSSAHQCWTACCCHSPVERLAWAIREGVEPPAYAHFSDEQWMLAANSVQPGSASCTLCVSKVQQNLRAGDGSYTQPGPRKDHPAGPTISALSCKGLSHLVCLPAGLGTRETPPWTLMRPGVSGRVGVPTRECPDCVALDAPVPPPRG